MHGMATAAKVINDALALPREERADLATRLLRSLDEDDEPDAVEAAWVTEIERRIVDRDAGRTGTESFGGVMAAITAQLAADRDPQDR